jgi:hypothetical protein
MVAILNTFSQYQLYLLKFLQKNFLVTFFLKLPLISNGQAALKFSNHFVIRHNP